MSKIAIGIGERLSARGYGRGVDDLVARDTGDSRDDHTVGDEELEWQPGHVRLDRIAAGHPLERWVGGLRPIAWIQRRKTASAQHGKQLVHVFIEDCVECDLELRDLRTAGLRRQEVEPFDADRSGTQTSS